MRLAIRRSSCSSLLKITVLFGVLNCWEGLIGVPLQPPAAELEVVRCVFRVPEGTLVIAHRHITNAMRQWGRDGISVRDHLVRPTERAAESIANLELRNLEAISRLLEILLDADLDHDGPFP